MYEYIHIYHQQHFPFLLPVAVSVVSFILSARLGSRPVTIIGITKCLKAWFDTYFLCINLAARSNSLVNLELPVRYCGLFWHWFRYRKLLRFVLNNPEPARMSLFCRTRDQTWLPQERILPLHGHFPWLT